MWACASSSWTIETADPKLLSAGACCARSQPTRPRAEVLHRAGAPRTGVAQPALHQPGCEDVLGEAVVVGVRHAAVGDLHRAHPDPVAGRALGALERTEFYLEVEA